VSVITQDGYLRRFVNVYVLRLDNPLPGCLDKKPPSHGDESRFYLPAVAGRLRSPLSGRSCRGKLLALLAVTRCGAA